MKKKIVILIILTAAAATVFTKIHNDKNFYYSGSIEATEKTVSSRVQSTIEKYYVDEGEKIEENAVIAELSCEDIKLANDLAATDYKRAEQLFKNGSMSRENYDKIKYHYSDSMLKKSWCVIKSACGGKILYKYKEDGELALVGSKIATVADLSEVWAYIYVANEDLSRIKTGDMVKGYLPEMPDKEFSGTITNISSEAEFTPKNIQTRKERTRLVFAVKVTFENPDEILKPAMTIEIKLP